jgi:ribosomal protein S18
MKILLTRVALSTFICMAISSAVFSQNNILDRAKKAIYQLEYQEAKNELDLYIRKYPNEFSNAFILINARCSGDPESPFYDADTAYEMVIRVFYEESTFDNKREKVVCSTFKACLDTVEKRKEQYVNQILAELVAKKDPESFKTFIQEYGHHIPQRDRAVRTLHQTEYDKAVKRNRILPFKRFIENYPDAEQMDDAIHFIEKLKYDRVVRMERVTEFEEFLEEYPNSQYASSVEEYLEKYRWKHCLKRPSINRYKDFLNYYPETAHVSEAKINIENLQWNQVLARNEIPYYRWFARTYPQSLHINVAQVSLIKLSGD